MLPDQIHRLLAIRYLFLIYLGWIWVKKGIVINIFTITLSFLSVISIVYFAYFNCNNEPIFYTTNWSYHRWPCYFYVSTLLSFLLILIYQRISKFSFINRATIFLARCSYEIFLIQMAVIALIPRFNNLGNKYLALFLWIIVVWAISLIGGYFFNLIYSKYFDSVK
jgi:peptidoglycan/LPS O-acetylase OafA/YrhL